MIDIISKILVLIVSIVTLGLGTSLLIKARSSRLYSTVFVVSLFSFLFLNADLFSDLITQEILHLFKNFCFIGFWYSLYKLWCIKYNQVNQGSDRLIILISITLSLILELIVINKMYILLPSVLYIYHYYLIHIFMVVLVLIKYFKYRKQNTTQEMNQVPYALLIFVLSYLSALIATDWLSLIFNVLSTFSILLFVYSFYSDYKKSFYY